MEFKKELDDHLHIKEEASKRDHRLLEKNMIYSIYKKKLLAWFWHPKGWSIYTAVEKYMREKQVNANYSEIKTHKSLIENYGRNLATGKNIEKICSSRKLMKNMQMKREQML